MSEKFADLDSAIAWAKTKVPEELVAAAASKIASLSQKHGMIADISAGMNAYPGRAEDDDGPSTPPFNYIWLMVRWACGQAGKEWFYPVRIKMQRGFTSDELLSVAVDPC